MVKIFEISQSFWELVETQSVILTANHYDGKQSVKRNILERNHN